MKEIYIQGFKAKSESNIYFRLMSYQLTHYSRVTNYICIAINGKDVLTTKPVGKSIIDRYYTIDSYYEMLAMLKFHNKIRKEDKNLFDLIKNLYF